MNTTPSTGSGKVMSLASRLIVGSLLPRIDYAVEESTQAFTTPEMLRPNIGSKRYGWTHYGVFLPNLPAPFGYCNVMTLLGATGAVMFDNDYLHKDKPRDTATFLNSTAFGERHHYRAYSIDKECGLAADGSRIAFGDNLVIEGSYPSYRVQAAWEDFRLDIQLQCTDTVSWFVRNVVYDHLSLLATCSGTISQGGHSASLDKVMCTFEYARCASPYSLMGSILPEAWKLPADFFTYQIINLDERTQLLLTDVRSLGRTAFKGVHVRTLDGEAEVHAQDVEFRIHDYLPEPAIAPDGRSMRLPRRFGWIVRDADDAIILDIRCTIASPWRYGHGRGYVASYDFEGSFRDQQHAGQGYIEYIDCETVNRAG